MPQPLMATLLANLAFVYSSGDLVSFTAWLEYVSTPIYSVTF
jgi:hypothetical protein